MQESYGQHEGLGDLLSPVLFEVRIVLTDLLLVRSVVVIQINVLIHAHQYCNLTCRYKGWTYRPIYQRRLNHVLTNVPILTLHLWNCADIIGYLTL